MDAEALVGIVFGCALTGALGWKLLEVWRDVALRRVLPRDDGLASEIRALREEIARLRQQNTDLILSLDQAPYAGTRLRSTEGGGALPAEGPERNAGRAG